MSPFEIQVHCYTLKTPSHEHHHLESPINILSSLPTDPPPSHIITRARGGNRDNHVAYISISSLAVTNPFERRSYCHGIVQSETPWPSEKGDKVWLRSDIPLLVGHKGVPVYNITKGVCCEVWIDNVDWRWDKQRITTTTITPPITCPRSETPQPSQHTNATKLILAGPSRNGATGMGIVTRADDDDAAEQIQMVILSAGSFHPAPTITAATTQGKGQRCPSQPRTQYQICCLTVRELREGWEDVVGKRSTPLAAGSDNGGAVVVRRRGEVKTMPV
ncbi:hypothetical protein QBC41DRAFT_302416 [Cercophora samala]|uniref:Uncharacterized protein n=1 Tax=Cercophora samala TaxID=330535 RepID=A0AA40DAN2_9PEZI|nr:hypothetical protein QBC41DRAFT_302416 [Cercophora samala]